MLVLTRRSGQSIVVGDDIVITILDLGRDQVRIGITAPRSVGVHREEVYQEILLANQAAAETEIVTTSGGAPRAAGVLPRRPR